MWETRQLLSIVQIRFTVWNWMSITRVHICTFHILYPHTFIICTHFLLGIFDLTYFLFKSSVLSGMADMISWRQRQDRLGRNSSGNWRRIPSAQIPQSKWQNSKQDIRSWNTGSRIVVWSATDGPLRLLYLLQRMGGWWATCQSHKEARADDLAARRP